MKLSRKIKKSTTKSAFSHFKEEDVAEKRRSTTVSEAKVSASEADDDEVNVKEDARRIYVATVIAEEHTEDLAAAEEHTEGLAAAEMDDGAGESSEDESEEEGRQES